MSDKETIGVYDARAEDYAAMASAVEDRPRLRDFIERFPDRAKVLDLGCGPGASSVIMADAGLQVHAWDASSEMVKIAGRDPRVTAQTKVFDDLATLESGALHGIWANFSLLHAPREALPGYLTQIARALTPDGVFMIAVKAGTGEERDSIGRLYTYFTESELEARLAEVGLTVIRTDRGRSVGLSGEKADWFGFTAVKDTARG